MLSRLIENTFINEKHRFDRESKWVKNETFSNFSLNPCYT